MKFLGTTVERNVKTEMTDALPRYYDEFREVDNITTVESAEFEKLNAEIADVLNQFYIDKATWGLAQWERVCGLPTDESKPRNQRRELIKSKLRGMGTSTVALIQNVAQSYVNGEVDVIEESAQYAVKIKFVGRFGVPENLADIEKALRDIIPAHLAMTFEFLYVTYDILKTQFATYDAMSITGKNYDDILNGR